MDSWDIGARHGHFGRATMPVRRSQQADLDVSPSPGTDLSAQYETSSLDGTRSGSPTSRTSLEGPVKVSHYKVWRKWGTAAAAARNLSASKKGGSSGSGPAVAVQGDALNHGPRLVAPSVGSEWRIHRLHELKQIQSKEKTCIVIW